MVTVIVDTVTDTHIDTDMDTGEERDPLMLNQKLKPLLTQVPGMDMVDTDMDVDTMEVTTDIHTDTDTDVIMDTVVTVTHMDTTDTTVKCHAIETVPAKTTLPSSLQEIQ